MSYQVIRTLIYTYPDAETALRDMEHWQVPATGVKSHIGRGKLIHSATAPIQLVKDAAESAGENDLTEPMADVAARVDTETSDTVGSGHAEA